MKQDGVVGLELKRRKSLRIWSKKRSGKIERKLKRSGKYIVSQVFTSINMSSRGREQNSEKEKNNEGNNWRKCHELEERLWISDWKSPSNTKQDEWKKIYI